MEDKGTIVGSEVPVQTTSSLVFLQAFFPVSSASENFFLLLAVPSPLFSCT